MFEECFGCFEAVSRPAPESCAGDFGSGAIESENWAFGMFDGRFFDGSYYLEPVAHEVDFAEGDAGLRHAEGPGVHAEKKDFLGRGGIFLEVEMGGFSGVLQGVVDVGDLGGEGQGVYRFCELV